MTKSMSTECEHDQNRETRWPDVIIDLDLDLWNLHAFEHETHDNDGYWDDMMTEYVWQPAFFDLSQWGSEVEYLDSFNVEIPT